MRQSVSTNIVGPKRKNEKEGNKKGRKKADDSLGVFVLLRRDEIVPVLVNLIFIQCTTPVFLYKIKLEEH